MSVIIMVLLVVVGGASAQPPPSGFDPVFALHAWYYAKVAFCDPAVIQTWTCAPCANKTQGGINVTVFDTSPVNGSGVQAYSAYNEQENRIVIAFRGSSNVINDLEDIDYFLVDYSGGCQGCQVHQGFQLTYQTIAEDLLASVSTLVGAYKNRTGLEILVTGHSLGAALALLAGLDVVQKFQGLVGGRVRVYTYGEPRVGNPAFAAWATTLVRGRHQRVTHKQDPVPRIPFQAIPGLPSWLPFGFLHVSHEVWYDNDLAGNNFRDCVDNATQEDLSCAMSQTAIVPSDHMLYMGVPGECAL